MNKNIYYIDYCLDIYSKPEIWDGEIKKYNPKTGYFENISEKNIEFKFNAIEIDIDVARIIMKNMIHSNYGILLSDSDEKWIGNFEKECKKRPELQLNEDLMYNYIVLKAILAGLTEEIATQLYAYYFYNLKEYKDNIKNIQTIEKILGIITHYIDNKKYWVPEIQKEFEKEFSIIDDIMLKRISTSDFDFRIFEARYLEICNNGYLKKIAEYNLTPNKYVKEQYKLEDIKDFLLKFYKITTNTFMDSLSEKYKYFKINTASRAMIYKNMEEIVRYSMRFWKF